MVNPSPIEQAIQRFQQQIELLQQGYQELNSGRLGPNSNYFTNLLQTINQYNTEHLDLGNSLDNQMMQNIQQAIIAGIKSMERTNNKEVSMDDVRESFNNLINNITTLTKNLGSSDNPFVRFTTATSVTGFDEQLGSFKQIADNLKDINSKNYKGNSAKDATHTEVQNVQNSIETTIRNIEGAKKEFQNANSIPQQLSMDFKLLEDQIQMTSSSAQEFRSVLQNLFDSSLFRTDNISAKVYEDISKQASSASEAVQQLHGYLQTAERAQTAADASALSKNTRAALDELTKLQRLANGIGANFSNNSLGTITSVYSQIDSITSSFDIGQTMVERELKQIQDANANATTEVKEAIEQAAQEIQQARADLDHKQRDIEHNLTSAFKARLDRIALNIDSGISDTLNQYARGRGLGNKYSSAVNRSGQVSADLWQSITADEQMNRRFSIFGHGFGPRGANFGTAKDDLSFISQAQFEMQNALPQLTSNFDEASRKQQQGKISEAEVFRKRGTAQFKTAVETQIKLSERAKAAMDKWQSLSKAEKERWGGKDTERQLEQLISQMQQANLALIQTQAAYDINIDNATRKQLQRLGKDANRFREIKEELGKAEFSVTEALSKISNFASGVANNIRNAAYKTRGILDKFGGLGMALMMPWDTILQSIKFHREQGQRRYAAMGVDASIGYTGLGDSAVRAQARLMDGNNLFVMSGGMIKREEIDDLYKGFVRQVGGHYGGTPQQTVQDMEQLARNLTPLKTVYGVSDATLQNAVKTYYKDMNMSAKDAENAIANLTLAAQNANVPLESYLSKVTNIAQAFMKIGIDGQRASSVLNNLLNRGIRAEVAEEIATQAGAGLSKFAENDGLVGFSAATMGRDPFEAMASMSRTHDEKGNPRKAWVDDAVSLADNAIKHLIMPYGDNPDLRYWGMTKIYRQQFGFSQRAASTLASAAEKYGTESETFKQIFTEEMRKDENPNATLEKLNEKIMGQLQSMTSQLAASDRLRAQLEGNLYGQASKIGSGIDTIVREIAPILLAFQQEMLKWTIRALAFLTKLVKSEDFTKAVDTIVKVISEDIPHVLSSAVDKISNGLKSIKDFFTETDENGEHTAPGKLNDMADTAAQVVTPSIALGTGAAIAKATPGPWYAKAAAGIIGGTATYFGLDAIRDALFGRQPERDDQGNVRRDENGDPIRQESRAEGAFSGIGSFFSENSGGTGLGAFVGFLVGRGLYRIPMAIGGSILGAGWSALGGASGAYNSARDAAQTDEFSLGATALGIASLGTIGYKIGNYFTAGAATNSMIRTPIGKLGVAGAIATGLYFGSNYLFDKLFGTDTPDQPNQLNQPNNQPTSPIEDSDDSGFFSALFGSIFGMSHASAAALYPENDRSQNDKSDEAARERILQRLRTYKPVHGEEDQDHTALYLALGGVLTGGAISQLSERGTNNDGDQQTGGTAALRNRQSRHGILDTRFNIRDRFNIWRYGRQQGNLESEIARLRAQQEALLNRRNEIRTRAHELRNTGKNSWFWNRWRSTSERRSLLNERSKINQELRRLNGVIKETETRLATVNSRYFSSVREFGRSTKLRDYFIKFADKIFKTIAPEKYSEWQAIRQYRAGMRTIEENIHNIRRQQLNRNSLQALADSLSRARTASQLQSHYGLEGRQRTRMEHAAWERLNTFKSQIRSIENAIQKAKQLNTENAQRIMKQMIKAFGLTDALIIKQALQTRDLTKLQAVTTRNKLFKVAGTVSNFLNKNILKSQNSIIKATVGAGKVILKGAQLGFGFLKQGLAKIGSVIAGIATHLKIGGSVGAEASVLSKFFNKAGSALRTVGKFMLPIAGVLESIFTVSDIANSRSSGQSWFDSITGALIDHGLDIAALIATVVSGGLAAPLAFGIASYLSNTETGKALKSGIKNFVLGDEQTRIAQNLQEEYGVTKEWAEFGAANHIPVDDIIALSKSGLTVEDARQAVTQNPNVDLASMAGGTNPPSGADLESELDALAGNQPNPNASDTPDFGATEPTPTETQDDTELPRETPREDQSREDQSREDQPPPNQLDEQSQRRTRQFIRGESDINNIINNVRRSSNYTVDAQKILEQKLPQFEAQRKALEQERQQQLAALAQASGISAEERKRRTQEIEDSFNRQMQDINIKQDNLLAGVAGATFSKDDFDESKFDQSTPDKSQSRWGSSADRENWQRLTDNIANGVPMNSDVPAGEKPETREEADKSRGKVGADVAKKITDEQKEEHKLSLDRNKLLEDFIKLHTKLMGEFQDAVTQQHGNLWKMLAVTHNILMDIKKTVAAGAAVATVAIKNSGGGGGGSQNGNIPNSPGSSYAGKINIDQTTIDQFQKYADTISGSPVNPEIVKALLQAAAAEDLSVDETIELFILAHNESNFGKNPDSYRENRQGAMGLMQFIPETAKLYGVTDRNDIYQATRGAAKLYKDLKYNPEYSYLNRDPRLIAAAYNAGPGNAIHAISNVAETREYIRRRDHDRSQANGIITVGQIASPNQPSGSVSGQGVVAFGDSIFAEGLGKDDLEAELPGIFVDAEVSRSLLNGGFKDLQKLVNSGQVGNTVIMEMGTNGFSEDSAKKAIELLGSNRQIYWANIYNPRNSNTRNWNEALQRLAGQYDNVHIIDWHGLAKQHPEWFEEDKDTGVHPNEAGQRAYAQLVKQAIANGQPQAVLGASEAVQDASQGGLGGTSVYAANHGRTPTPPSASDNGKAMTILNQFDNSSNADNWCTYAAGAMLYNIYKGTNYNVDQWHSQYAKSPFAALENDLDAAYITDQSQIYSQAKAALDAGKPIILYYGGRGGGTGNTPSQRNDINRASGTHAVVLSGYDTQGQVLVIDPNGGRTWHKSLEYLTQDSNNNLAVVIPNMPSPGLLTWNGEQSGGGANNPNQPGGTITNSGGFNFNDYQTIYNAILQGPAALSGYYSNLYSPQELAVIHNREHGTDNLQRLAGNNPPDADPSKDPSKNPNTDTDNQTDADQEAAKAKTERDRKAAENAQKFNKGEGTDNPQRFGYLDVGLTFNPSDEQILQNITDAQPQNVIAVPNDIGSEKDLQRLQKLQAKRPADFINYIPENLADENTVIFDYRDIREKYNDRLTSPDIANLQQQRDQLSSTQLLQYYGISLSENLTDQQRRELTNKFSTNITLGRGLNGEAISDAAIYNLLEKNPEWNSDQARAYLYSTMYRYKDKDGNINPNISYTGTTDTALLQQMVQQDNSEVFNLRPNELELYELQNLLSDTKITEAEIRKRVRKNWEEHGLNPDWNQMRRRVEDERRDIRIETVDEQGNKVVKYTNKRGQELFNRTQPNMRTIMGTTGDRGNNFSKSDLQLVRQLFGDNIDDNYAKLILARTGRYYQRNDEELLKHYGVALNKTAFGVTDNTDPNSIQYQQYKQAIKVLANRIAAGEDLRGKFITNQMFIEEYNKLEKRLEDENDELHKRIDDLPNEVRRSVLMDIALANTIKQHGFDNLNLATNTHGGEFNPYLLVGFGKGDARMLMNYMWQDYGQHRAKWEGVYGANPKSMKEMEDLEEQINAAMRSVNGNLFKLNFYSSNKYDQYGLIDTGGSNLGIGAEEITAQTKSQNDLAALSMNWTLDQHAKTRATVIGYHQQLKHPNLDYSFGIQDSDNKPFRASRKLQIDTGERRKSQNYRIHERDFHLNAKQALQVVSKNGKKMTIYVDTNLDAEIAKRFQSALQEKFKDGIGTIDQVQIIINSMMKGLGLNNVHISRIRQDEKV